MKEKNCFMWTDCNKDKTFFFFPLVLSRGFRGRRRGGFRRRGFGRRRRFRHGRSADLMIGEEAEETADQMMEEQNWFLMVRTAKVVRGGHKQVQQNLQTKVKYWKQMCCYSKVFLSVSSHTTHQASQADQDDCVKMFVCQLSSSPDSSSLSDFESSIRDSFAATLDEIDVSSGAVEFNLASVVGRSEGAAHCERLYSRCAMDYGSILEVIRDEAERVAAVGDFPEKGNGLQ